MMGSELIGLNISCNMSDNPTIQKSILKHFHVLSELSLTGQIHVCASIVGIQETIDEFGILLDVLIIYNALWI